jgi:hypothetical protein
MSTITKEGYPKHRWCTCKECKTKFWINWEDDMTYPCCNRCVGA